MLEAVVVLQERAVTELVTAGDAVTAVEATLQRAFGAQVRAVEDTDLLLDGGHLTTGAVFDPELGLAAVRGIGSFGREGECAVAAIVAGDRPELLAVVELNYLRRLAAAAVMSLAATRLAKPGARSVGLIGCGALGAIVLEVLRASGPAPDRVVAYCRNTGRLAAFCEAHGAGPAEYGREAAECDIVVAATTSADPVLRGEWLSEGAFVAAAGAAVPGARELDNVVVRRSAFVCCDSLAGARRAADLAEPVDQGILDWLEVHELAELVTGGLEGRQSPRDVVLLKCTGAHTLVLRLAYLAVTRATA